jgi:hypothetical protein
VKHEGQPRKLLSERWALALVSSNCKTQVSNMVGVTYAQASPVIL